MTETLEQQKEAFLAHYGVPGMRWGKRKAGSDSSGGDRRAAREAKRAAREAADKEIIDARVRQDRRSKALNVKAAATYTQTTKKGQLAAEKAFEKAEKTYLTGPDAITAAKLTRGEKQATAVMIGVAGAALVAQIALSSYASKL